MHVYFFLIGFSNHNVLISYYIRNITLIWTNQDEQTYKKKKTGMYQFLCLNVCNFLIIISLKIPFYQFPFFSYFPKFTPPRLFISRNFPSITFIRNNRVCIHSVSTSIKWKVSIKRTMLYDKALDTL